MIELLLVYKCLYNVFFIVLDLRLIKRIGCRETTISCLYMNDIEIGSILC